jgi:hypothetical protein
VDGRPPPSGSDSTVGPSKVVDQPLYSCIILTHSGIRSRRHSRICQYFVFSCKPTHRETFVSQYELPFFATAREWIEYIPHPDCNLRHGLTLLDFCINILEHPEPQVPPKITQILLAPVPLLQLFICPRDAVSNPSPSGSRGSVKSCSTPVPFICPLLPLL